MPCYGVVRPLSVRIWFWLLSLFCFSARQRNAWVQRNWTRSIHLLLVVQSSAISPST